MYARMCVHLYVCIYIYVGVKECFIFTGCCSSLLIDARQQRRVALAWAFHSHIAPLRRQVLIYLELEKFPCFYGFYPLLPTLLHRHPSHSVCPTSFTLLSSLSSFSPPAGHDKSSGFHQRQCRGLLDVDQVLGYHTV